MNRIHMRTLSLALAFLLAPTSARADLSSPASGVYFDLGAGLGAADRPFRPGFGMQIGIGGWFGRYDDTFSIGRQIAVGLRLRQDLQLHPGAREIRTYPMLEIRRGIDLLVVGVRFGVVGGPVITSPAGEPSRLDGGTARVVGSVNYRFSARWRAYVRLEAGVDVVDVVQPALGLLLGVELIVPR